jgi:hypothetical protein
MGVDENHNIEQYKWERKVEEGVCKETKTNFEHRAERKEIKCKQLDHWRY